MAPSLARVAARLEMLSRAELLDIAARGCVENKEVCRYADVLLAKRAPLPEWAVERVLLSPDLLEHVVSALPLVDLSSAAVCSTWRSIWARSLKVRRVLRPSRRSAEADLGLPWKSFAPEGARPESMLVLPGWGGSEPVVCLGYSMPPRVVHVLVDTEVATEHTMTGDHVGWLSSLAADNEHLYAITYRGARPVDHAGGGSYVTRFQISGSRIQRINERAVQYAREATVVRGGPFFVVLADGVLHALDRLSLLTQFTVAREVLGIMSEEDSWAVEGLTSCGTEIFLSNQLDHTLRVLSASGEPIRTIANGGWNFAKGLCAIEDRIFITEDNCPEMDEDDPEDNETYMSVLQVRHMRGQRIFVVSAATGDVLQVFKSPSSSRVAYSLPCPYMAKLLVLDLAMSGSGVRPLMFDV